MSTGTGSPQGRRVLVARVTGDLGERIQAWRERFDPEQAARIPPHATLCYWAPVVDPTLLERQVRYAFDDPVRVTLGSVHQFDNADGTFYIDVQRTEALDAARRTLYDATYLELPGRTDWTWHVTCVRYSTSRDLSELHRAATELEINAEWTIDTVSYLELRGDRYVTIAEWDVG